MGLSAARPKGPPIINLRSEGRNFPVGRCLVPALHFFEFTGTRWPKTKWKFTKGDEDWFWFARLWPPTAAGEAFTLLTTDPNLDVAPMHDRQMVVLERSELVGMARANRHDLLKALPADSLRSNRSDDQEFLRCDRIAPDFTRL